MRCATFLTRRIGLASLVVLAVATETRASTIPLTPADLEAATLIDFSVVPPLVPVDGLTVDGVTFSFTIAGVHSNVAAVGDGGPVSTNNITFPTVGNNFGTGPDGALLSMTFPGLQTRMGYGYAILAGVFLPNATTVSLFDGANNLVGSLSGDASPDPLFSGGFLGVASDIPFLRADVTFIQSDAWAFDNLRFSTAAPHAVPEPATVTLFGLATMLVLLRRSTGLQ